MTGAAGSTPGPFARGGRLRVLFVCTGNSARSQMAEAILRSKAGAMFEAMSAGTKPSVVNPLTVRALAELGIDAGDARSKSVDGFVGSTLDYVVTVCDDAREACPYIPGARRMLHWSLEDPGAAAGSDEERMATFRRIRDEITERVAAFVVEASKEAVA